MRDLLSRGSAVAAYTVNHTFPAESYSRFHAREESGTIIADRRDSLSRSSNLCHSPFMGRGQAHTAADQCSPFAAKPLVILAPQRHPDGVQSKAPVSYLALTGARGLSALGAFSTSNHRDSLTS